MKKEDQEIDLFLNSKLIEAIGLKSIANKITGIKINLDPGNIPTINLDIILFPSDVIKLGEILRENAKGKNTEYISTEN